MSFNSSFWECSSVSSKWIFFSHGIKTENRLILMMIMVFMATIVEYQVKGDRSFLEDYKAVVDLNTKL